MDWRMLAVAAGAGLVAGAILAVAVVIWMVRREPYATFYRLKVRAKVTFLRLLIFDRRLPWYIRAMPLVALVYLVSPIDLIPFFPFDDIAIALLVVAVMVWLTPRELIAELLSRAEEDHAPGRCC